MKGSENRIDRHLSGINLRPKTRKSGDTGGKGEHASSTCDRKRCLPSARNQGEPKGKSILSMVLGSLSGGLLKHTSVQTSLTLTPEQKKSKTASKEKYHIFFKPRSLRTRSHDGLHCIARKSHVIVVCSSKGRAIKVLPGSIATSPNGKPMSS